MHIGKQIKKIRIAKHLKQSFVAAAIGISITAYSDIEREKTSHFSIQRLEQIALVLEVPLAEMFFTGISKNEFLKRIDELKKDVDDRDKKLKNLRGG